MTTAEVGEQVITITADAPIIDVTNTDRSLNIDGDFIKRMPITYDREWDAAWALVPGTVNEGQFGPFGNRVNVHGASVFQNVWNLEGMNVGDTFANSNDVYFSTDIIEEVHIVTTGFDASVSAGQGGYINVVTKSGGNDFSGSAAIFYQPTSWNWSNVDGGDAPEQSIVQPDFTFGGPILRDTAWFFGSYRYQNRDEAYGRTADDLAYFDQFDLPRPTQGRETRSHQFFGKVTYQLSDSWKLAGTFNSDRGAENHADMPINGTDDSGIEIERGGEYYNAKIEGAIGDKLSLSGSVAFSNLDNLIFGNGGFDEPAITRYLNTFINSSGLIQGTGNVAYYNNRRGFGWGSDTAEERLQFRADARY
ncbi:MAG: hypothetical protein MI919_38420, partial [Holophagales bacterium]|nr:hypothetical protein [Holophagales bacterium]